MLISCPKCNSVYNISDTRVPNGGKKFKCAECGEVWKVFPQDVQQIEPESRLSEQPSAAKTKAENDDINVMFSRLSHNTKNLFTGETAVEDMAAADKLRQLFRSFFSSYAVIAFLLVLCIILTAYLAYQKRYEIVAKIPAMEKVYARFNLESVYLGRNMIFRDVRIREIDNADKYAVEISGRLFNNGKISVKTLPVKATFIDKDGNAEGEIIELIPPQRIAPGASTLFRLVADNPSPNISKVELSMDEISQE